MKRLNYLIYTIIICSFSSKAQVVLNEIYTDPGSGNHEFFELYNTSTSASPISLDNYCIVTYYEDGSRKGFYVMDLPNLSVDSKNYFVGSAGDPYSIQGSQTSKTSFNWNNPVFMAANNGYLKKWENKTSLLNDGNAYYDEVVTTSVNDFLYKKTGAGFAYLVCVFRNGLPINIFQGGTSSTSLQSVITSMPDLYVGMSGSAGTNFTINWTNVSNTLSAESTPQTAGSDNGFIRAIDGQCGTWEKSSADVKHTPMNSNGQLTAGTGGTVTLATSIIKGNTTVPSTVTFDITEAPTVNFPIEVMVYTDNGSVVGQHDVTDTYITSKTESVLSDGPFTVNYTPFDVGVVFVIKRGAGCFDKVHYASIPVMAPLPIKLISFAGNTVNNKAQLTWSVAENETGERFEIEQSTGGGIFTTAAIVFTTEKIGLENYAYKASQELSATTSFRLKIVNKNNTVNYSRVISINKDLSTAQGIKVLQNPIGSVLSFTYNAELAGKAVINIYNTGGAKVYAFNTNVQRGANTINQAMDNRLAAGNYVLEVATTNERRTIKITK